MNYLRFGIYAISRRFVPSGVPTFIKPRNRASLIIRNTIENGNPNRNQQKTIPYGTCLRDDTCSHLWTRKKVMIFIRNRDPFCDPVGIRTQDPQLRRLLLYPAELPDQSIKTRQNLTVKEISLARLLPFFVLQS